MNALNRIAVVGLVAGSISACGLIDPDSIAQTPAPADPFLAALSDEYLALARAERAEFDWVDGDVFAQKGEWAREGTMVPPEQLSDWYLPAASVPALSSARQRLMTQLNGGATSAKPVAAAKAQAGFDCWVQEQEENHQPEDIAACRKMFEDAMAELEAKAAPAPQPVAVVKPVEFQIFFPWDSAQLHGQAYDIIRDAAQAYKERKSVALRLDAHTDRSGPIPYNDRLSTRRAELVTAELVKLGVPRNAITAVAHGERDVPVPTADGVREQRNRVVIIRLAQ